MTISFRPVYLRARRRKATEARARRERKRAAKKPRKNNKMPKKRSYYKAKKGRLNLLFTRKEMSRGMKRAKTAKRVYKKKKQLPYTLI